MRILSALQQIFHRWMRKRTADPIRAQKLEELVAARTADLNRAQAVGQIGNWRLDVQRNSLTWSEETHRIFNVPPGTEMTYDFFLSTVHPSDRVCVDRAWQAALRGAPYDIEHRILLQDGTIKWVHERAELDFDAQHALLGGFGTVQDVTARKQIEFALQRTEERYRLLVEQTIDGIFVSDPDGRLIEVNSAGCDLFGYRREEILHMPMTNLMVIEDATMFQADLDHHAEGIFVAEYGCRRKNGSSFTGEITGRKFPDGRLQAILRDVTGRKVIELAREQALLEAERLARVHSDFLANMSHEIRTPLNAVLGLAQVGLRDSIGRRSYTTFSHILKAGELLLSVVNDILDFSKIEAGRLQLEEIPFLLGDVIDQVVDITAYHAFEKELCFLVDEAPDLPEHMIGDALRLSQILVNLLSNAVKFTERGEIVLTIKRQKDGLCFLVRDTGIGMTSDQVARLFNPFEQADGSTTRRFGGTGLGLTISKRLIDQMGGKISVESDPNHGTLFRVFLPQPDRAAAPLPSSLPNNGPLLLVGLEPWETDVLSPALAACGIAVEQHAIEQACAACALESARLVLLPESALLHAGVSHAIQAALAAGRQVALLHIPGSSEHNPIHLPAGIVRIKHPLRVRQIINAYQQSVVNHPPPALADHQRLLDCAILAAEDNEMNRLVLEEILRQWEGARLLCVENGRLAVEQIQRDGVGAWDLVLMDIQMPEMDGYEATRLIHACDPGLPVIGLTAHALADERARCLQVGMVEHVTKPVETDPLVATILHHRRLRATATPVGHVAPRLAENPPPPNADHEGSVSTASPLVDWTALAVRYQKNPAFITKLVQVVRDTHANTATLLRTAITTRDPQQIAFIAHKLTSVAGGLMAHEVCSLARQTETLARQPAATSSPSHPAALTSSGALYDQASALANAVDQLLVELSTQAG